MFTVPELPEVSITAHQLRGSADSTGFGLALDRVEDDIRGAHLKVAASDRIRMLASEY